MDLPTRIAFARYLHHGATLQDSLLQSYRNFHITLQSIFLAVASGLTIMNLRSSGPIHSCVALAILVSISVLSLRNLRRMQGIILARGKDVNFWHRRLIRAEQDMPVELRTFTQFKIHQKLRREHSNHLEPIITDNVSLNDEDIDRLVERGLEHTRRGLDVLLTRGLKVFWYILIAVSVGSTAWRVAGSFS